MTIADIIKVAGPDIPIDRLVSLCIAHAQSHTRSFEDTTIAVMELIARGHTMKYVEEWLQ